MALIFGLPSNALRAIEDAAQAGRFAEIEAQAYARPMPHDVVTPPPLGWMDWIPLLATVLSAAALLVLL